MSDGAARYYGDHHASAALVWPAARVRLSEVIASGAGNPSSVHHEGRLARKLLGQARAELARAVGAASDEVVFTSGVTESLRLAVAGLCGAATRREIWCGHGEHPALGAAIGAARDLGFTVQKPFWPTSSQDAALIATHAAHHETGELADLAACAQAARATGAPLLIDGAQASLSLAEIWAEPAVTALAFSSHKLGGPSGVGCLLLRRGASFLSPLAGGPQEHGLRAGTEALALIAAFARAVSEVARRRDRISAAQRAASEAFERQLLQVSGARLHGSESARVPGVSCAGIVGVPGRRMVDWLSDQGVMVSSGPACSSANNEPSEILRARGVSRERALEAFRVSFGFESTVDEALSVAATVARGARELRRG